MNNEQKIEIFYLDKNYLWSIFVSGLIGLIPFFVVISSQIAFFGNVYTQIVLLFLLTVMFMCIHCNSITPNRINKRIIKHLSLIIGVLFLILLPDESTIYLKKIMLFYNSDNSFEIYTYFLIAIIVVLNALNCKHDKKTELEYYYIITIFICINIINNFFGWNIYIALIKLIFEAIILIKEFKMLRNKKLIKNNKVNIIYIFTFVIMLNLLICKTGNDFYLVRKTLQYIFLITISVSSYSLIKSLKELLFQEKLLEKTNMDKELAKINEEISKKNLKLEKYHKINKERQSEYREFLRKVPKPIAIIDKSTHRVVYSNEKFLELTNLASIKEILNTKINYIINIDNYVFKEKYSSIKRVSAVSDKEKLLECNIIKDDVLQDEIVLVFNDITDQVKYKELKKKLEEKEMKSKVKKNFLSNISHDLKLPINVIYSAIQLQRLFIEQEDIENITKYNNVSKENCITLTKLTNNLLDISKINSEHLYPILRKKNIVEFAETCVERFIPYAQNKNIEIIFDTEYEEVYMYYDEEFIERIIMNLIYNSLKFTPAGGNILVDISIDEDKVYLSVKDTGVGMSEEFTKNMFKKYAKERNNSNVEGSGVGLFVVYNLVKLQNGDIYAESKINEGSKFIISFNREKDENIYDKQ